MPIERHDLGDGKTAFIFYDVDSSASRSGFIVDGDHVTHRILGEYPQSKYITGLRAAIQAGDNTPYFNYLLECAEETVIDERTWTIAPLRKPMTIAQLIELNRGMNSEQALTHFEAKGHDFAEVGIGLEQMLQEGIRALEDYLTHQGKPPGSWQSRARPDDPPPTYKFPGT
jgi:hypothetical protein